MTSSRFQRGARPRKGDEGSELSPLSVSVMIEEAKPLHFITLINSLCQSRLSSAVVAMTAEGDRGCGLLLASSVAGWRVEAQMYGLRACLVTFFGVGLARYCVFSNYGGVTVQVRLRLHTGFRARFMLPPTLRVIVLVVGSDCVWFV